MRTDSLVTVAAFQSESTMGAYAAALTVTVVMTFAAVFVTRRLQILDHPSPRSLHSRPIPRAGGVGPFLGVLVGLVVAAGSFLESERLPLVVAATAFGVLGLSDDVHGLSPMLRLFAQFTIACVVVLFLSTGQSTFGLAAGGIAVFWIVAFVNCFNFMDGINGISVAQASLAGGVWWIVGRHEGIPSLEVGAALICIGAIGFLPFNFPRASIFLGDVGSYFFGGWLGVLVILGIRAKAPIETMVLPLGVYLADTGTTLASRLARRERWTAPHRDHVYQRLVQAGWSHARTTSVVALFVAVLCVAAFATLIDHGPWRALSRIGAVLVIGLYLSLPALVRRHQRRGGIEASGASGR
jgi:UDP-GlcNAc:undecaprenyl-phosphate/decaprenyl-phosphate GlcNAc-1-phosphate transferase